MKDSQIKALPKLINEDKMTLRDIAKMFDVHVNTVNYWVRRLRDQKIKLKVKKGPKFRKIFI